MANLDDLSVMIGEIRSDIKHVLRWQQQHEVADQERFEQLADRIDANNGYGPKIIALEGRTAEVEVVVASVKKIGWMGKGFLLALSLVGGATGAWALQIAKWF